MAHYNTHSISIGDKFVKTYTILNLTPDQVLVLNCLVSGAPVPKELIEVANDIKSQVNEMAKDISVAPIEAE